MWAHRDLPVLIATVELTDEMVLQGMCPAARDIAERSGLGIETVIASLNALDQGAFLEVSRASDFAWDVTAVTGAARREIGQWPSPESIVDRLIAGVQQAAERETEAERKSWLRTLAGQLSGSARAILVNVVSDIVEQRYVR